MKSDVDSTYHGQKSVGKHKPWGKTFFTLKLMDLSSILVVMGVEGTSKAQLVHVIEGSNVSYPMFHQPLQNSLSSSKD